MKAKPFKQSSETAFPPMISNSEVAEALAIHAKRQKPKTAPNAMPVTPTLPRVPKPYRNRRRGK